MDMSDIYLYSVAIYPVISVMDSVKRFKDDLASSIGWYGSRNSKAHITICEFNADAERELVSIKSQLQRLCATESPLDLKFDHVGMYENKVNGVACLLPDKETEEILKPLMKRIGKGLKVKNISGSNNPHITIGRKLNKEQVSFATDLFKDTKVNLNFICDRVVLRVLNRSIGQFEVIEEFIFQSKTPRLADGQLLMF